MLNIIEWLSDHKDVAVEFSFNSYLNDTMIKMKSKQDKRSVDFYITDSAIQEAKNHCSSHVLLEEQFIKSLDGLYKRLMG